MPQSIRSRFEPDGKVSAQLLEAREAEAERREKEEHGKAAAAAAAAHEHPHAEAPKHEMTKEEALLDQELRAELAAELGE